MKQETSSSEHSSIYSLTSQLDILSALRSLLLENRLIQMRAPGGQASILTTLLHIDSDKEALIFDGTSDIDLSNQIAKAKKLYFEASQNGIHISFASGPTTGCLYEHRPAFSLPYPAEVVRVQRREAFRVATPISKPAICTIPQEDGAIQLPLEDLSSSGMGVSDPGHELDGIVGQIYEGCTLALPGFEPLTVTLRLVQMREFERAEKPSRRLGFAFENLRGVALGRVQRYVSTLERDELARSRGFK